MSQEVGHTLLPQRTRNFHHTQTSEKFFLCSCMMSLEEGGWLEEGSTLFVPLPLRSMGSPLLLWGSPAPSDECSQAFDNHAIQCCWLQLTQSLMFNLRARTGGNWEESPLALLLRNTHNYTGFHTIPTIHTISQRQHGALQPFKLPLWSRHEWEGI